MLSASFAFIFACRSPKPVEAIPKALGERGYWRAFKRCWLADWLPLMLLLLAAMQHMPQTTMKCMGVRSFFGFNSLFLYMCVCECMRECYALPPPLSSVSRTQPLFATYLQSKARTHTIHSHTDTHTHNTLTHRHQQISSYLLSAATCHLSCTLCATTVRLCGKFSVAANGATFVKLPLLPRLLSCNAWQIFVWYSRIAAFLVF